ncbi:MAG: 4-hydroxybenzoate octaprenyltransferase [Endozoicomonadaceae bacterium]|nr:4-hydroxybenzoate octaprenyltransferase [Endozoicomonadaceae bacterium]
MKATLHRYFPRHYGFIQLMRLDKPIGTLLLLWPTLWSLWLSAQGMPNLGVLAILVVGVILMRCAGCVINDYIDRHFDGNVKRTRMRPLVSGKLTDKEALLLFVILVLASFTLVLLTNPLTIGLSFVALALVVIYPFMKRHTHLPQVVLGAAFGWSIPMAWAAQTGELTTVTWLLFTANLLWTIAYDTQYAMVDRDDDLNIGIKSTAILFGKLDTLINAVLQALALLGMMLVGTTLSLSWFFYLSLLGVTGLFVYQYWLTRTRDPDDCFKAFLSNHWVGAIVFIGIFGHYISTG